MATSNEHVGIVGGTGAAGSALAARLASIGCRVVLGSREVDRATASVASIMGSHMEFEGSVVPGSNAEAAKADIVVLATPWDGIAKATSEIKGELSAKVVVCMSNALVRVGSEFQALFLSRGSVAQTVQALLPMSHVVAALQHVAAKELGAVEEPLHADILVTGDDVLSRNRVIMLLGAIDGANVYDAGSLSSAGPIEAMTAVLLNLNLKYKTRTAIRILGIEGEVN